MRQQRRRAAKRVPTPRVRDPQSDAEERSLIQRVKARDQAAFEVIYRQYRGQVHRQVKALVGNEEETEEIVVVGTRAHSRSALDRVDVSR